jgi:L-2-hydroxyglutarate oxidase LhgO
MPTAQSEIAIIGAGVVGLACAAELARAGHRVLVLERRPRAGQETSSRNSGVVHAGLYYPPGSLKARLCIEGRALLYERCTRRGIPHRRVGKLIVAAERSELPALEAIEVRARACGAGELEVLDADAIRWREPRVRALAGLFSPETGIIDAAALVESFEAELETAGGNVLFRTRVVGLEPCVAGWRVQTEGPDGERHAVEVGQVVNAAGLEADRIAALAGIDVANRRWRQHPCKGDYFAVAPALGPLTRALVYPVPGGPGLGIHVTLDLGGRYRLGPDAEYVESPSYAVDPAKAPRFAASVARWLPGLTAADLSPELAGVRPRLQGPGEAFRDFLVADGTEAGAPGTLHLLGIESPGLTASPALARCVAERIGPA